MRDGSGRVRLFGLGFWNSMSDEERSEWSVLCVLKDSSPNFFGVRLVCQQKEKKTKKKGGDKK